MTLSARLNARLEEFDSLPGPPVSLSQVDVPAPAVGPDAVPLLGTKIRIRTEVASLTKKTIGGYAEVQRICELPIDHGLSPEETDAFGLQFTNADQHAKGWRFFDIQAEAILNYMRFGGAFLPIGVGWGKTLVSLMVAELAFRKGLQKTMLLVPPDVCHQLLKTDIGWARRRVHLTVPFMSLYGKSMVQRRQIAGSGKVGCYIVPYSLLSTKDTITVEDRPGVLDMINPDLIIADEAHKLKNRNTTRTKRLVNWIHNREVEPEMVAMSGTVTAKSIMDYHHLIGIALGANSPLPRQVMLAKEWASVIDADSQFEPDEASTGPIKPLVDWALDRFFDVDIPFSKAGFRKAYKLRLATAPGVAATGDTEIGTSLNIQTRPVEGHTTCEGWSEVDRLMAQVNDAWVTPNGDEIEHAIHTFKWSFELTAGFYNELVWPDAASLAKRTGIGESEASDLIRAAKVHHEANQTFVRALRKFLQETSLPGLDTPLLVTSNMARYGRANVPLDLFDLWSAAKELEVEGMPTRDSRVVRLCDYKVKHALEWAEGIKGGKIVWYHHNAIGDWLTEMAKERGMNPVHCHAGAAGSKRILDHANADRLIIASITAHGTGKNLQHFEHTYFVQWPRPAIVAEQVLGRLHRNGQEADELLPQINTTTEFDALNFAACLNDALYIHQSTGNRQKLVYAGYDPLPTIFPSEVLRERGFQNRQLTKEQQEYLDEKFV